MRGKKIQMIKIKIPPRKIKNSKIRPVTIVIILIIAPKILEMVFETKASRYFFGSNPRP